MSLSLMTVLTTFYNKIFIYNSIFSFIIKVSEQSLREAVSVNLLQQDVRQD